MKTKLPAGLNDDNGEFFSNENWEKFLLTGGNVIGSDNFSQALLRAADTALAQYPKKEVALVKMTGTKDRRSNLLQFLVCNYGDFDENPDMINGLLQAPEFCPCPKRGSCKFEGVVCDPFKTKSGHTLTKRELQIIRLTATGELDKQISAKLNISIKTVTTHTGNIRRKTQLARKADITRFAYQHNLIS